MSEKSETEKRIDALNKETDKLLKEHKAIKGKLDKLFSENDLDRDAIVAWMEEHPLSASERKEAEKAMKELEKKYGLDGADDSKKKKKTGKGLRKGKMTV